MLGVYLRLVLFIAGLIGAVLLFAFAFTAAAVVLAVVLLLAAIFGRKPQVQWTVFGQESVRTERARPGEGPIIDHDPNDLPPQERDDDRRSIPLPPSRD